MRSILALAAFLIAAGTPARAKDISALVARLETAQGNERLKIVHELGLSKNRDAVPVLLALLDPDHGAMNLTWTIAEALAEIGDPRAGPALAAAWAKEDTAAMRDIMASRTLPIETIAHVSMVRSNVMRGLSVTGGPGDCGAFVAGLEDPRDDALRRFAAEGLGRFKCAVGVDALVRLSSSTPGVAYEALGSIGGRRAVAALRRALRGDDPSRRLPAAYGLALAGDAAGGQWLRDFVAATPQTDLAGLLAAHYLARLKDPAGLERLKAGLDTADEDYRASAISKLGSCGDPRAEGILIDALDRESADVRVLIASALGHLGGSDALAALRRLKERDPDETVRNTAKLMLWQNE